MNPDLFGKTLALLNAITWAAALVLFKKSGQSLEPLALNLFKNCVGIALILMTIAALAFAAPLAHAGAAAIGFSEPPAVTEPPAVAPRPAVPWHLLNPAQRPLWILLISGVIGIAIADSIFFYGLNLAGVGMTAIVDCLYTPFMILFAWLLISEQLNFVHFVGAGLILTAVLLATSMEQRQDQVRHRHALLGSICCATAVGLMALAIVMAKPTLEGQPVLWTSLIRLVAGTIALLAIAPWFPGLKAVALAFRPSAMWRVTLPASFFGAYLAMIFWIGGMAYTNASVAAMLNQCSSVFALLLAAIFLREKLTAVRIAALGLAFAGVMVVVFDTQIVGWWKGPGPRSA